MEHLFVFTKLKLLDTGLNLILFTIKIIGDRLLQVGSQNLLFLSGDRSSPGAIHQHQPHLLSVLEFRGVPASYFGTAAASGQLAHRLPGTLFTGLQVRDMMTQMFVIFPDKL
ncbi:hypothetical protein CEXT_656241 [Caerostris extrusa]|uniref:Uncharacterized protein n=1 Tax=Caerostris extrusa TaxID=172846 RepID=A0AAV4U196_CAEEX|nr:hypothetical protein CEXT_656241 [Caerostris extrusa]